MKRLSAALCAFALSACVSVIPQPDVAGGLYTIDTSAETPRQLAATVVIRQPETQKLFAGRTLISKASDGAARIVPGVQWSDTSTRLLQLGLLDLLSAEGAGVAITPQAGAAAEYELAWRVSDFSVSNGSADVQLELTLLDARNREALAQTVVAQRAVAVDESAEARIQALEKAAKAALTDAADFVAENAAPMLDGALAAQATRRP